MGKMIIKALFVVVLCLFWFCVGTIMGGCSSKPVTPHIEEVNYSLLCADVWCEGPFFYEFIDISHGFVSVTAFDGERQIGFVVCPGVRTAFEHCMNAFDNQLRGE
jgi:hypothetical protein